jgi:hypothetical protein
MAVGAANFTLGEFVEDSWPGKAALNQRTQRQAFLGWLDMIELQNQRISLAAVYTWVIEQVLP